MIILIPTDLSDTGEKRLFEFIDLLQGETKIVLFHSVEAKSAGSTGVMNMDQLMYEDAIKDMDRLIEKINTKKSENIEIESKVLCGYFDSDLEATLNTVKPDLLVLISKSRKGIDKLMNGRKSLGLIGEIKQPILVIPVDAEINNLHRIGFAIDQAEPLSNKILSQLSFFTNYFKSDLKTFHINDNSEQNLDYYKSISDAHDFTGKVEVVLNEDVKKGIDEWVEQNKADALVILTHDKNFFEKLFNSSISRKLIKENKTPLLVLTK